MSLQNFNRIHSEIALGLDDVLLEPAASSISPEMTTTTTFFSRGIPLHLPFVLTCNDADNNRVEKAIAIAQLGGIGILPHDMAVSKQAEMVRKVKRFQTRIVQDVITATPDTLMAEVLEYRQRYDISCIPIIDPETRQILDLLWLDDALLSADPNQPVSAFPSGKEIHTAKAEAALQDIHLLMREKSADVIILLDDKKCCAGLVTKEDMEKLRKYPNATLDSLGKICVVASVGTGEPHLDRVSALIDAGVDAIIVDAGHGHNKAVLDMVTYIRRQRSGHVDVVAGNIVTSEAALALIDAGASAIKVGLGFDKTCPLRLKSGVGIPQLTALLQVTNACSIHQIPVIADGGIDNPGNSAKAFAAGAASITINHMLAQTEENLHKITESLLDSLQCAMAYTGCETLKEFGTRPRFIRTTKEA